MTPQEQIDRIIQDLAARRRAGEAIDRQAVEAQHPELMPALGEALDRLERERAAPASTPEPAAAGAGAFRFSASRAGPAVGGWERLHPQIEGYEILERIGRGGMGEVFKARQLAAGGRIVALKILSGHQHASPSQRRRFEREVEIASELHHPNIAELYDSGLTRGQHFFAMQYVDGLPLDEYARRLGLAIPQRLALFQKICAAMAFAHHRGVIHRDLKPSNILVDSLGEPHVLDFGLAKQVDEVGDAGQSLLTQDGVLMGTLPYMAPEQAAGDMAAIDTRTDVYALGVILYELLTGGYPYEVVGQMASVLHNIAHAPPRRPSTLNRRIGGEVETIVLCALAKERDRRYASASDLGKDIARFLAGEAVEARPPSLIYQVRKLAYRHRRLFIPAGVAVAVVVVVTAVAFVRVQRDRDAARAAQIAEATARQAADAARDLAKTESESRRRTLYAHQIALADAELRDANITRVRQLLEDCPPDLRGWEWQRLQHSHDDAVRVVKNLGAAKFLAWHPDGSHVGTLAEFGRTHLVDARTGQKSDGFPGFGTDVSRLVLRPDWSRGVSLSYNVPKGGQVTIGISDPLGGKSIDQIALGGAAGLGLSPDATRFACFVNLSQTAAERRLLIRDLITGAQRLLPNHGQYPSGLAWVDEHRMVTWDNGGEVRLVNPEQLDQPLWSIREPKLAAPGPNSESAVCVSPDKSRLACGRTDGGLRVRDLASGSALLSIGGDGAAVSAMAFDPTGKILAVGNANRIIRLWDAQTGAPIGQFVGHEAKIEMLRWSPAGDQLASVARDGSLRFWAPDFSRQSRIANAILFVRAIAVASDGRRLASNFDDAGVCVWDARTLARVFTSRSESKVTSLAFLNHDRWLAGLDGLGTLQVWDLDKSAEVRSIRDAGIVTSGSVFHPAMCPAPGRNAVYVQARTDVRLYDLETGALERTLASGDARILRIALSPDGHKLAVVTDQSIALYETDAGRPIWSKNEKLDYLGLEFRPDAQCIASAGRDGAIRLWDTATGALIRKMAERKPGLAGPYAGMIENMAWSPDGRRIATAGWDNMVKLWDPEEGRVVLTLRGHGDRVNAVAFSPDGHTLYSCSADATLRAWDTRPTDPRDVPDLPEAQEPSTPPKPQFPMEAPHTAPSRAGGMPQTRPPTAEAGHDAAAAASKARTPQEPQRP